MKLTLSLCAGLAVGALAASLATPASVFAQGSTLTSTNSAGKDGTNDEEVVPVPGRQFTNSIGMEMIKVSDWTWAGKYVVTQAQYRKLMGSNPSAFSGDNNPVDSVSWNDAMAFCKKLTEQELKDKVLPKDFLYTLPTDGEWDALKADAAPADAVMSQGARRDGTAPVGSLGPNSLGLYDTLGDVTEFSLGDTNAPTRFARGTSYADRIEMAVLTQYRTECKPDEKKNTFGFRVILKGKPAPDSSQATAQ